MRNVQQSESMADGIQNFRWRQSLGKGNRGRLQTKWYDDLNNTIGSKLNKESTELETTRNLKRFCVQYKINESLRR